MLALLVAGGGLYGTVSSDVFATSTTEVAGNTWTSDDAVLAALAVPDGQNVFTVRTTELESRLTGLPAVQDASVTVALPDRILVDVVEREALVAWRVGDRRFLVDADGFLFGELPQDAGGTVDELPVVDDRRAASRTLDVGTTLDAVSLDAALRLGSLRPTDVGSRGERLAIRVDDAERLRHPRPTRGLVRDLRLLHADPATHGHHPGPGAPAAQPHRGSRGRGPAGDPRGRAQRHLRASRGAPIVIEPGAVTALGVVRPRRVAPPVDHDRRRLRTRVSGSVSGTLIRTEAARPCSCPSWVSSLVSSQGLSSRSTSAFEFSRYSAVAILAALDSVLGAVRAELDGVYDNRIFISGFLVNAIVAVLLVFIGDRLSLDLYLVALINFGFRIFNNVALIRRHFI